jgi:hypothetical protein
LTRPPGSPTCPRSSLIFLVVNIGTNDGVVIRISPLAWEAIYVGVLRKLRTSWPRAWFLLGCAPCACAHNLSLFSHVAGWALVDGCPRCQT